MKGLYPWKYRDYRMAVVMGLVDGIMTALLLAAKKILDPASPVDLGSSLRIAVFALVTAGFVFYIGRYAELRAQLVRAAAQLNLRKRGRLATTRLGRMVLQEAAAEAVVSGCCSFLSALLPLSLAAAVPSVPWLSLAVSLFLLGLLGSILGRTVRGSPAKWSVGLVAGGLFMTILGFKLHVM